MEFSQTRRAFIVVDSTIFLQDASDHRTTKEWCAKDFNIVGDSWNQLIRGYMLPGIITFFTNGDDYSPVLWLPSSIATKAVALYREAYVEEHALYHPDMYNGVFPQENDEIWPHVMKWDSITHQWVMLDKEG